MPDTITLTADELTEVRRWWLRFQLLCSEYDRNPPPDHQLEEILPAIPAVTEMYHRYRGYNLNPYGAFNATVNTLVELMDGNCRMPGQSALYWN